LVGLNQIQRKDELGLSHFDLIVTVRPPSPPKPITINPEAESLLDAALDLLTGRPDVSVNFASAQRETTVFLQKRWSEWIAKRRIIIPDHAVDGLNLIWFFRSRH